MGEEASFPKFVLSVSWGMEGGSKRERERFVCCVEMPFLFTMYSIWGHVYMMICNNVTSLDVLCATENAEERTLLTRRQLPPMDFS